MVIFVLLTHIYILGGGGGGGGGGRGVGLIILSHVREDNVHASVNRSAHEPIGCFKFRALLIVVHSRYIFFFFHCALREISKLYI